MLLIHPKIILTPTCSIGCAPFFHSPFQQTPQESVCETPILSKQSPVRLPWPPPSPFLQTLCQGQQCSMWLNPVAVSVLIWLDLLAVGHCLLCDKLSPGFQDTRLPPFSLLTRWLFLCLLFSLLLLLAQNSGLHLPHTSSLWAISLAFIASLWSLCRRFPIVYPWPWRLSLISWKRRAPSSVTKVSVLWGENILHWRLSVAGKNS